MSNEQVPILLVGCGNMGRNHLRVLLDNPAVKVVGVVEPSFQGDTAPGQPGVRAFRSIDEYAKSGVKARAAVLATPTETHHEMGMRLLAENLDLLIEKPLASTDKGCNQLIAEAKKRDKVLAVGHVERHNPAVNKLRQVIERGRIGKPIHFTFTRVGGYPRNVKPGNNVILDLAVHDIDVLRSMIGPLRVISSVCHQTLNSDVYDTAEILFANEKGVSASIHVNWITPTKIRTVRVTGSAGICSVDYIMQTCEMLGGDLLEETPFDRSDFQSLIRQYQNSDKVVFGIQNDEPLKIQLRAFLAALAGDSRRICTGADGQAAVRLAEIAFREPETHGSPSFY